MLRLNVQYAQYKCRYINVGCVTILQNRSCGIVTYYMSMSAIYDWQPHQGA